VGFLNWDLISLSSAESGIPNIFVSAPASATFMFRPRSLNWSPVISIPFFFSACLWVFILRLSMATRTSACASCDSIGMLETASVLKLWPPRIRDA